MRERLEEPAQKIKDSYEQGVTVVGAEALAGEFLSGMIEVSEELRNVDLDARMRKSGVKAVRAAVYLEEIKKADKKPSDSWLEALINSNELVTGEQDRLDESEVQRDLLESYYSVFKEAHIYFRGISKGSLG